MLFSFGQAVRHAVPGCARVSNATNKQVDLSPRHYIVIGTLLKLDSLTRLMIVMRYYAHSNQALATRAVSGEPGRRQAQDRHHFTPQLMFMHNFGPDMDSIEE